MFRTTYRMCLKIKYEGYSKFEKNHLNREINKYKADKACFLGQWRMPKINNTITWGIERPWTVEQFPLADINASSMLKVLQKVTEVCQWQHTRPLEKPAAEV